LLILIASILKSDLYEISVNSLRFKVPIEDSTPTRLGFREHVRQRYYQCRHADAKQRRSSPRSSSENISRSARLSFCSKSHPCIVAIPALLLKDWKHLKCRLRNCRKTTNRFGITVSDSVMSARPESFISLPQEVQAGTTSGKIWFS